MEEGEELPQLIVVDGGKGQLSAAVEALDAMGLRGKIAVVGIAKRLEEIYFPGDSLPLYIDKKSETLKVVQHLRDEAHRFGITHHRNRRSKTQTVSEPRLYKRNRREDRHRPAAPFRLGEAHPRSLRGRRGRRGRPAKAAIIAAHFAQ